MDDIHYQCSAKCIIYVFTFTQIEHSILFVFQELTVLTHLTEHTPMSNIRLGPGSMGVQTLRQLVRVVTTTAATTKTIF